MLLERYYNDALAQASYLIGCEETGEAVVIDPNVTESYAALARRKGMRVAYVTETHIHADFVSGSRALASAAKAQLLLSAHGGDDWSYRDASALGARLVRDGESIEVGLVRLEVMHTPGHTPEHICFLVTDTAVADRPIGLVSGDFVFVGDVGRPDLLEKAAKVSGSMRTAARDLFRSLQRLKQLPDYLQIWPGHGAGSACGKALGAVPQTTLGYERLYNPALRMSDEGEFAAWVLADQPDPPPYFAIMKRWNRDGPPTPQRAGAEPNVDADAVLDAIRAGHQVLDTRSPALFAKEHLPGTINFPLSKSSATYAGTVLSYDKPMVVLGAGPLNDDALGLRAQLAMIGLRIDGVAPIAVLDELKAAGHTMATLPIIDAGTLAARKNGGPIIDVRGTSEWDEGHIPGATHVYLGDLLERTRDIAHDEPVVVHCQTGVRSSIAASLLRARGFSDVTNFAGGFAAWRKAGLPIEGE